MLPDCAPFSIRSHDGLCLRGEVYGPENGLPIVLLHGGAQSRSAWRVGAARLGALGFRACAMDMRGHGESAWSPQGAYTFEDYVSDLAATVEALGAPALLVGASLGGHIAMLTASRRSELAIGLALADITPWLDEKVGYAVRDKLRIGNAGFASLADAADAVAELRGDGRAGSPERLRRHMRVGDDGRYYWHWDPALMDDGKLSGGGPDGVFRREAMRLRVPVLAMRAEHSNVSAPEDFAAFQRHVPDVTVTTIAGAQHMLTADTNEDYCDAIVRFLKRIAPAAFSSAS